MFKLMLFLCVVEGVHNHYDGTRLKIGLSFQKTQSEFLQTYHVIHVSVLTLLLN